MSEAADRRAHALECGVAVTNDERAAVCPFCCGVLQLMVDNSWRCPNRGGCDGWVLELVPDTTSGEVQFTQPAFSDRGVYVGNDVIARAHTPQELGARIESYYHGLLLLAEPSGGAQ